MAVRAKIKPCQLLSQKPFKQGVFAALLPRNLSRLLDFSSKALLRRLLPHEDGICHAGFVHACFFDEPFAISSATTAPIIGL
jgi:hypothetical protein